MFNKHDLNQLSKKGVEIHTVEEQIKKFKEGFPFINLSSSATIENNGIEKFNDDEVKRLNSVYENGLKTKKVLKFVPASGAASRMFKALHSFQEKYDGSEEAYQNYLNDKSFNSVYKFINDIKNFAFYNDLKNVMNDYDIDECIVNKNFIPIIEFLLFGKGLDYSELPKGLLKFHKYENCSRSAFEEHLVEAVNYCKDVNNNALLHFTVSPEHELKFKKLLNGIINEYEKKYDVKFNVTFSIQKSSTDTIAVDMHNEPFREKNGSLLFRPGGHGALIENLNDLNGDVVFIKNIDNIVPDRLKPETTLYKKVLAGYLIELQTNVFRYLEILSSGNIGDNLLLEIKKFSESKLKIVINDFDEKEKNEKIKILFSKLNRPIRVCGMVKNEGEPGGGPFWVKNENGEISLQIIESSQIDFADSNQKEIFEKSTHFNPVDLVCGVKDYKGNNFNLLNYIDSNTGFISVKSKDGKDLKAMELPGLWNGAMADWITVFVEVPIITFNPVKTINDLLRKEHQ